ncbi:MAG: radical SAM protein [Candidatus Omnitrophica bacterium]|nr:radical SAM protein [Candidatus Omnitrophota bacterium]
MRYIYGPLLSRRLGLSLGISPIPFKTCDFDCVYCQLGATLSKTKTRKEYVNKEEILSEIRQWLKDNPQTKINYITLSGSGEPTLNSRIGEIIQEIKNISSIPVAVITNSSFLIHPEVRRSLLVADLIIPSLSAVDQDVFQKINRPAEGVKVDEIINGLIDLRKEYKGKIWLEVMLVRGVNDDLRHIQKLNEVITRINPDKIQLNRPIRHTTVAGIRPPDKRRLNKIKEILGEKCQII